MRPGAVLLRNKIARHLNGWEQLGCKVVTGNRFFAKRNNDMRLIDNHLSRLIVGCSSRGKMILIYPVAKHYTVPRSLARFLMDFHSRGALVGCAKDIGDAWDIAADSPQYKRKKSTYAFINRRTKDGEAE